MKQLPKFSMQFEAMTIEHLGLRLYNSLPPVMTELVSNAYDAESARVDITLPTTDISPDSEVVIRDYGHALTAEELQNEYLPIGRNRRGEHANKSMSKHNKRHVTGRKGLGKLSCFGVADEMEIRSIVDGNAITLRLDYPKMKAWPTGRPYEPEFVAERSGPTDDATGVEIRMRRLRRKYKIDPVSIRKGLAKRLGFIGTGFSVKVNGTAVQPGDRVRKDDCVAGACWDVAALPHSALVDGTHSVSGWIGFVQESSSTGRGVDIFAHGKAVELGSYFNFSSTHAQFPRSYLVGHVTADFLDDPEADLVATARNQVLWDEPRAQALQKWGEQTLTWAFNKWVELRKKEKERRLIRVAKFDDWLKGRTPSEQRAATRMVKLLVDDDRVDAETAEPLLEIIKVSVESAAFADLLDALETRIASTATLLNLFKEWRVIEAREHLRLADGRRAAIEQLDKFIRSGALEVQQMQPLLRQHLWLLDPAWTQAEVEQHYSALIAKHAKESKSIPEKDRRMDILGVSDGRVLTIVEIKRPEKTLTLDDLNQIERYVDWAQETLRGTGDAAFSVISGLLIVGQYSSGPGIRQKIQRLQGSDIRVQIYADVSRRAKERYDIRDKELRKIAPEYARGARKKAAAGRAKKKARR